MSSGFIRRLIVPGIIPHFACSIMNRKGCYSIVGLSSVTGMFSMVDIIIPLEAAEISQVKNCDRFAVIAFCLEMSRYIREQGKNEKVTMRTVKFSFAQIKAFSIGAFQLIPYFGNKRFSLIISYLCLLHLCVTSEIHLSFNVFGQITVFKEAKYTKSCDECRK